MQRSASAARFAEEPTSSYDVATPKTIPKRELTMELTRPRTHDPCLQTFLAHIFHGSILCVGRSVLYTVQQGCALHLSFVGIYRSSDRTESLVTTLYCS